MPSYTALPQVSGAYLPTMGRAGRSGQIEYLAAATLPGIDLLPRCGMTGY